jgi:phytoene dehydrogenase-like protein
MGLAEHDVVVLERRGVLGGAAVTEEPWPGYQVSSASYVVSLMPQRIVDELQLTRHGYDVSIIAPDYFVPFPDGTSLTLWGDMARDRENIGRLSKHDAQAWVAFDAYFERGGNIMQGELTPDQMFSFRPIPFYGDHRTPVEGLYLCGGGTHPGGGVMGIPGRNASTVVLKALKRGRGIVRIRDLVTDR